MNVQLPGGLAGSRTIEKQARFHAIDGHIETACYNTLLTTQGTPGDVTQLLRTAVAAIGPYPVKTDMVRALCEGDRKHLLVCLCMLLKGDTCWLQHTCRSCSELYDIPVNLNELPVKPAGDLFPFAKTMVRGKQVIIRIPTGGDLEAVAGMTVDDAVEFLMENSVIETPDFNIKECGVLDLESIHAAIEQEAPDVGTRIQTRCPSCDAEEIVEMDLWHVLRQGVHRGGILHDVHMLASHYHWSENDILSLTRAKRQVYLKLIDQHRGIAS